MRGANRFGRREWLWRGALVALSTIVTFGVLELGVRIAFDRYQCDDRIGWTYRAQKRALVFNWTGEFLHFVQFNQEGLRDREIPAEFGKNMFRVLLLGDSFSAGLQVPEGQSFPKLLESELRPMMAQGILHIENAAVDGFGTAQALEMYSREAERSRPNVVMLGLFLANDLADNTPEAGGFNHYLAARCGRPYFRLGDDGKLVQMNQGNPVRQPSSWRDSLLRQSELYANLFPRTETARSSFADWDVFTGKNAEAVDAAWNLTSQLVRKLNREVQAKGGTLIVLLIPHEQEAKVLKAAEDSGRAHGLDFDRGHARAEAFLREERIYFVDLYPSLRQAMTLGERPYFRRDMHWNDRGHQIVAETIRRWFVVHCADLDLPLTGCASRAS